MDYTDRNFMIFNVSELNDIDFNQVLESSADTLRYSVDGTETFVKYEVTVIEETYTQTFTDPETQEEISTTVEAGTYGRPSIYSEAYTEYDHEGILALLATEAWTAPIEDLV